MNGFFFPHGLKMTYIFMHITLCRIQNFYEETEINVVQEKEVYDAKLFMVIVMELWQTSNTNFKIETMVIVKIIEH